MWNSNKVYESIKNQVLFKATLKSTVLNACLSLLVNYATKNLLSFAIGWQMLKATVESL